MADAKGKTIERVYNVPLRKEFMKVPRWKKTKKAVTALRQFLQKHMKTQDVKLSRELNEAVWKHGIKNPPHHIKVTVTKNSEGVANADLFGAKKSKKGDTKKEEKKTPKAAPVKEEKKSATKVQKEAEAKQEQEALVADKPEPKVEKLPEEKDEKATQAVPNTENQKM